MWHCYQGWVWLHLQWLKSTEKVKQQMKEAQAEESSDKKRRVVRRGCRESAVHRAVVQVGNVSVSPFPVLPANGDLAASLCHLLPHTEACSEVSAHHTSHGGLSKVYLGQGEHPV